MKIRIEEYNPGWTPLFEGLKNRLTSILSRLDVKIEHIGSTSVPGLAAKPVIDIMVGVNRLSDLDLTIGPMTQNHFIYYQLFNAYWPDRRLYVGLKEEKNVVLFQPTYTREDIIPHEAINSYRLCHIHIWPYGSKDWIRHLAFREYLKEHEPVRSAYAELKKELCRQEWQDGMAYNDAKDVFIKEQERKALEWFGPGEP